MEKRSFLYAVCIGKSIFRAMCRKRPGKKGLLAQKGLGEKDTWLDTRSHCKLKCALSNSQWPIITLLSCSSFSSVHKVNHNDGGGGRKGKEHSVQYSSYPIIRTESELEVMAKICLFKWTFPTVKFSTHSHNFVRTYKCCTYVIVTSNRMVDDSVGLIVCSSDWQIGQKARSRPRTEEGLTFGSSSSHVAARSNWNSGTKLNTLNDKIDDE